MIGRHDTNREDVTRPPDDLTNGFVVLPVRFLAGVIAVRDVLAVEALCEVRRSGVAVGTSWKRHSDESRLCFCDTVEKVFRRGGSKVVLMLSVATGPIVVFSA